MQKRNVNKQAKLYSYKNIVDAIKILIRYINRDYTYSNALNVNN